jgi:hypothetical protein
MTQHLIRERIGSKLRDELHLNEAAPSREMRELLDRIAHLERTGAPATCDRPCCLALAGAPWKPKGSACVQTPKSGDAACRRAVPRFGRVAAG